MSLNPIFPIIDAKDFSPEDLEEFKTLDLDSIEKQLLDLFQSLSKNPSITIAHGHLSHFQGGIPEQGTEVFDYEAKVVGFWTQADQFFVVTATGHTVNVTKLMERMKEFQKEQLTK